MVSSYLNLKEEVKQGRSLILTSLFSLLVYLLTSLNIKLKSLMTMVSKLGTANISLLFSNSTADLYYINLKLSLLNNVILKIMTSNHINCVHTRDLKKIRERFTFQIYILDIPILSILFLSCSFPIFALFVFQVLIQFGMKLYVM